MSPSSWLVAAATSKAGLTATNAHTQASLALEFEEAEAARTGEVRALVSRSMLPRLVVSVDQLRDLPIDPRTAFLVSLVDGQCSVGMIAHIAGMPSDDVIGIFAMLLQLGAVELRDPP